MNGKIMRLININNIDLNENILELTTKYNVNTISYQKVLLENIKNKRYQKIFHEMEKDNFSIRNPKRLKNNKINVTYRVGYTLSNIVIDKDTYLSTILNIIDNKL